MPSVFTLQGGDDDLGRHRGRDGATCKRVPIGKRARFTIEACKDSRGRWRFQKGTVRPR